MTTSSKLGAQNAFFAMPFCTLKTINLPGQARDKHRENFKNEAFLAGAISGGVLASGVPAPLDLKQQRAAISGFSNGFLLQNVPVLPRHADDI
jgi:hypothetical protein